MLGNLTFLFLWSALVGWLNNKYVRPSLKDCQVTLLHSLFRSMFMYYCVRVCVCSGMPAYATVWVCRSEFFAHKSVLSFHPGAQGLPSGCQAGWASAFICWSTMPTPHSHPFYYAKSQASSLHHCICPSTPSVTKDSLELLFLCQHLPECWDYRPSYLAYTVLELAPRA